MKAAFRKSYVKDLEKPRDTEVRGRIREAIGRAERAETLQDVGDIRRLRGGEGTYWIRVGDHRLGLILDRESVVFARCLHRKDLYRYFP